MSLAKSEANILHQKIKDNDCSHEEVIRILTTRSKAQLCATFTDYKNEFGNSINKVHSICKLTLNCELTISNIIYINCQIVLSRFKLTSIVLAFPNF